LEVHASIHVEDVCNEVDKTTFNTPLELSYEVDNTIAYDGHVDSTYDEDFQSANDDDSTSYLSNDDYDDSGVLGPNHDKDLVLGKFPLDVDLISQELCMKDDKEEADFGKLDCEYKSENLYEDDSFHESHHLAGKLKVSEDMIIAAIKHFDDTHKLMANCCWRAPGTHKNFEGELSLADFQALREALVVMKSNYLHLLSDRDHLLMLDEIYFDVLKGKQEEVDKLTHGHKITKDSLKSTQMALQESEIQVDELYVELTLAHSSSSIAEIRSSLAAITHEDVSSTHDLREEPLVMVKHEEHSDLHGLCYSASCRLGKARPNHRTSSTTWESYTQCHLDVGPTLQG
jgi:hypothetical protein